MIDRNEIEPGHMYAGSVFPRSGHSIIVVVLGRDRDTSKLVSHHGPKWMCVEVSRSPATCQQHVALVLRAQELDTHRMIMPDQRKHNCDMLGVEPGQLWLHAYFGEKPMIVCMISRENDSVAYLWNAHTFDHRIQKWCNRTYGFDHPEQWTRLA